MPSFQKKNCDIFWPNKVLQKWIQVIVVERGTQEEKSEEMEPPVITLNHLQYMCNICNIKH